MAPILEPSLRLIECPEDLTGCKALSHNGRQLLYFEIGQQDSMTFIIILGYFSGQVQDGITKDLIEPITESNKAIVNEHVLASFPGIKSARVMFL